MWIHRHIAGTVGKAARQFPALVQTPAWGAIWENLAIGEVRKRFLNAGKRPPIWFWPTAASYPLAEAGRVEALPLGGQGGLLGWVTRYLS